MTPLTPIIKINSLERVDHTISPNWPNFAWFKGKVIHSSTVSFTIDDGTETMVVMTRNSPTLGVYVLVSGTFDTNVIDGIQIPQLAPREIHVILFFRTSADTLFALFLVLFSALCTAGYWIWQWGQKGKGPVDKGPIEYKTPSKNQK